MRHFIVIKMLDVLRHFRPGSRYRYGGAVQHHGERQQGVEQAAGHRNLALHGARLRRPSSNRKAQAVLAPYAAG